MLKDDLELSREDIQLLSNSDALAAFFAKLGYDTNDRLIQNVAAMGFSSDNLKSAIIHIERLATQDARLSRPASDPVACAILAHTVSLCL